MIVARTVSQLREARARLPQPVGFVPTMGLLHEGHVLLVRLSVDECAATVVAQLFHMVEPQRAYFGQKDAQQVLVIDRMIRDLHMPVELRVGDTVREPDGLALSSRNTYLSRDERKAAPVLGRALDLAERRWLDGERDAERLRKEMAELVAREPLARLDYVSIADPRTLDEMHVIDRRALVALAAG